MINIGDYRLQLSVILFLFVLFLSWSCGGQKLPCYDGTQHGQCSVTQPHYCENGILYYDCRKCGCREGRSCKEDAGVCSRLPSIMTYASFNEIAPPSSEEEWQWEIDRIDMAHGEDHFVGLRERQADIYYNKYLILLYHTPNLPSLSEIESWCTDHGYDFESAFLHYYDDSQTSYDHGTTCGLIPGYGGGSASTLRQARVPHDNPWSHCEPMFNPKSDCYKRFMIDYYIPYYVKDPNAPGNEGYHHDGLMYDTMNPLGIGIFSFNGSGIGSGGHVREYGNRLATGSWGLTSCEFGGEAVANCNWNKDFTDLMSDIRDLIKGYGVSNTAQVCYEPLRWFACDEWAISSDAEGTELYFNSNTYDVERSIWQRMDQVTEASSIFVFAQTGGLPTEVGNYKTTQERHEMSTFAAYLTGKDSGSLAFYSQQPSGGGFWEPLRSYWNYAQERDLGQPVGSRSIWVTGTDTAGQSYEIYRREYSKAIILFRPRHSWGEEDNLNSPSQNHTLEEDYRILYPDDSLGNPMNQIALAVNEGVVLIKDEDSNGSGGCGVINSNCGRNFGQTILLILFLMCIGILSLKIRRD